MTIAIPVSEFTAPDKFPNPSGIQPVEYKCLTKPYEIEETDEVLKRAKEAGLEIAGVERDREQMAQVIALVVAVGGNAFEDWRGEKPKPGDRVMMAKYAGLSAVGADGRSYRLCHDKDIAAVLFQPSDEVDFDAD